MLLWPLWIGLTVVGVIVVAIVVGSSKKMAVKAMRVAMTNGDGMHSSVRLAVRYTEDKAVFLRDIRVEAGPFLTRETIELTRNNAISFAELLEDLARRAEA